MQRLGLNPTEQEVVDIPNEIARKAVEIVITINIITTTNRVLSGINSAF